MCSSITIREEYDSDIDAIRGVHQSAFSTDVEARLVDQLRAAGHLSISLVALLDDQVVGHIALSPITVDGAQVGLGIAPVAVAPDRQRCGIGSALVRWSLTICSEIPISMVVVLGEPKYYGRFGFVPASVYGLSDAYGGGDAFQAILIVADRPPLRGLVKYAPAFALFD